MRVPISWLRDYVALPDDADAVASALARLGFPVDAIETRPTITGVVIGRIERIEKHPNADRLQVCTIDVGSERRLTIATAATNVAQGQTVPVATIGAVLPHLTIAPRTMRGIASEGMLCSGGELALEPEWFEDGIMQLDADMPLGANAIEVLGLAEAVLDVDVTPNRVDAFSMIGLARELAAAFGVPLRLPETMVSYVGPTDDVRVTIESVDCRRYVAQRVGGLEVRPAPAWMRVRLALAGQRPINNLVDISNFVMLETSQPLHFFDHAKIAGKHIIVRDARPGEHLVTLDGTERTLDASALVIADEEQATGLAGLMGGLISEVGDETREVVIESANWTGPRIRRMSVALGLRTEASTRNEKHLAPALTDLGAARAAALLAAEGGRVREPIPYGAALAAAAPIALPKSDIPRLLGFTLTDAEVTDALEALGFTVALDADTFAVTAPAWRTDVAIAADVVEEIARIAGYDRLAATMPVVAEQPLASDVFERDAAIATVLCGLGYHECMTLALQPAAIAERDRTLGLAVPPVARITNPLSEDQRYLRYTLLHAHLALAARDRALRPYRTFEIGHIFEDADDAPRERNVVTLVATTAPANEPAWRSTPFLALKSDVRAALRALTGRDATVVRAAPSHLHPGKSAELVIDGVVVGVVGVVDPRLARAYELDGDVVAATLEIERFPVRRERAVTPPSRFPAIERDLAVVVDTAVAAADITAIAIAQPDVRDAHVFDEYRGAQIDVAKKSLALRVTLQREDATMTDAQADAAIAAIVAALRERFGAVLRQAQDRQAQTTSE
jgi:phenylalanyl-tRNA synthetase beta chain